MGKRALVWAVGIALLLGIGDCLASQLLRTNRLVSLLADSSRPRAVPPPLRTRVAAITRAELSDAYANGSRVAEWLNVVRMDPSRLLEHVKCVREHRGDDPGCDEAFLSAVLPALGGASLRSEWGLPAPIFPPADEDAELDAERLVANAARLGEKLNELSDALSDRGIDDGALRDGITDGLQDTARYMAARGSRRSRGRQPIALVLSGGAANGAFTAGFVYRLLEVLESCRTEPDGACVPPRIDLAVGASAGALISLLADMYFVPGLESRAKTLLRDQFTCSVESSLYCQRNSWVWEPFAGHEPGLVEFDELARTIRENLQRPSAGAPGAPSTFDAITKNDLELVTVAVDAESGLLIPDSDQEPRNAMGLEGRVQSVLASVVEPALAVRVPKLPRVSGALSGTFVDGGVVSPLPVMEAARRGATRAILVSNWPREVSPADPPRNAFGLLLRGAFMQTIELVRREAETSDLAVVARRMTEYAVCSRRFPPPLPGSLPFCERRSGARSGGEAESKSALSAFPQVASAWQSVWIKRPEDDVSAAAGYAFDPRVMRPMFREGVHEYQRHCREIDRMLGIEGTGTARRSCPSPPPADVASDPFATAIEKTFVPIETCLAKEKPRICR